MWKFAGHLNLPDHSCDSYNTACKLQGYVENIYIYNSLWYPFVQGRKE